MDVYRTEEEQVEALKGWAKEYGRSVVVGVSLCMVLVFGWRAWQNQGVQEARVASAAYDTLYQAVKKASEQGATEIDRTTVDTMAEPVLSEWSDTAYASFARLLLARQAVETGQLDKARDLLEELAHTTDDGAIRHLASLRLARVLMALGDYEAALRTAPVTDDQAFQAAYLEVRGDIFVAQGERQSALDAYEAALKVADGTLVPLIEMKRNDVRVSGGQMESDAEKAES